MAVTTSCCTDFLLLLGFDLSLKILLCVCDPSDLVRASSVSTSWRRLVIENRICKKLCLKMYPRLSYVCRIETSRPFLREDALAMEHSIYSSLSRALITSPKQKTPKAENHVDETIAFNEMLHDMVEGGPSYLLTDGDSESAYSESSVFRLASEFCVVTGILVHPFPGDEEVDSGGPIITPKALRIQLGHSKSCYAGKRVFDWVYTSPVFPMVQLQTKGIRRIMLPEPVLCIGGILRIEFVGKITRPPARAFIRMISAEPLGWNLSPEFKVGLLSDTGRCVLRHNPEEMLLQHRDHPVDCGWIIPQCRFVNMYFESLLSSNDYF